MLYVFPLFSLVPVVLLIKDDALFSLPVIFSGRIRVNQLHSSLLTGVTNCSLFLKMTQSITAVIIY